MMTKHGKVSERDSEEIITWVHNMAPWKVFATHTFKRCLGEWEAAEAYQKFMLRVLPSVTYFYGVEENPSRDGHHIHAMWAHCGDILRRAVWKQWFHQHGRCRIEPIRKPTSVSNYCTKYVVKEGTLWGFALCSASLWHYNVEHG